MHYTILQENYFILKKQYLCRHHIIQICSGITSGRMLDGELLYTKNLEVNLFAFAYRLFEVLCLCRYQTPQNERLIEGHLRLEQFPLTTILQDFWYVIDVREFREMQSYATKNEQPPHQKKKKNPQKHAGADTFYNTISQYIYWTKLFPG